MKEEILGRDLKMRVDYEEEEMWETLQAWGRPVQRHRAGHEGA